MERKTKIINLWGGPGCGKSTIMAGVFYELKRRGYCCEMVLEYAKDKVWAGSEKELEDQFYITAKQYHRIWKCLGKVDYVVTDHPLPLGIYYDKSGSINFRALVMELWKGLHNINFFLERDTKTPYEEAGRLQSLEESLAIDRKLKNIIVSSEIEYSSIPVRDAVFSIVDKLVKLEAKEEIEKEEDERRKGED